MNNNDQVLTANPLETIKTLRRLLEAATPLENNGASVLMTTTGKQFTDEERKIIKDKLMGAVKSL